jgi:predicted ATPase/DNA-binding SARP family transcriptional activator
VAKAAEAGTLPRQRLLFRVLGPLEVEGGAGPLRLGGRKQRALLGLLLLHAGEVVSGERLVDELWGERPPATAATSLRNLVTQLRRLLGGETIVTRPPGYLLEVEPEQIDLPRFERLLAEARKAEPREQARLLREALALWRGPPLGGLAYERFAQDEIRRLEELRLEALEERLEAELALGQGVELVPELEALVQAHPLRERLRAQLMLALYRAGRQADALAAYQAARRTLVDELGVEPSPALQELQGAILRQEPALTPAPRPEPTATRLPAQPTPFLGRARELAEVVALLQRADLRLLTLTGAGGSGKTRLALRAATEVAPDYPDGVCWVPLASLRDPTLVPASVAQAVAVKDERELAAWIGERRLLLLLDNCEHLLAAAPGLARLLSACPNLKLLATSREPLHLAGEREYLVPTLAEQDALELFRQRAHTAEPQQTVLAICRRLDCLPLAIELAAARTKLLPPEALLQRLDRRLPLLTGGPRDAPERQRTLEATIKWSYDLLDDSEQRLLGRLAVFAGGCTLAAAEQVCDADLDTLQALVEKNLLRRDSDRFSILETIREYIAERAGRADEREGLQRRHAEHFLAVAETMARADDQREILIVELDNLRTALLWAIDVNDPELALRLAARGLAAALFSASPTEARRWLEDALALASPADQAIRAEALRRAGRLASEAGDHRVAVRYLRRSLADSRMVGDRRLIAMALVGLSIATLARAPERTTVPRKLLREALDTCKGLSDVELIAVHALGELELLAGNNAKAKRLLERALSLGPDERSTGEILGGLGDVALNEGAFERAASFYRDGLVTSRNLRDERNVAYGLAGLSAVAAAQGQPTRAGRLAGAIDRIQEIRKAPLLLPNPRYERLLEATPIAPEDVEAGRAMTLDEAVAYALEETD